MSYLRAIDNTFVLFLVRCRGAEFEVGVATEDKVCTYKERHVSLHGSR